MENIKMTDKKLLQIARDFSGGILDNGETKSMCYVVTTPLQGYLSMCGIETRLIEGEISTTEGLWNHFWLELSDGRILDPTASQFITPKGEKMPKIYLGERPGWYKIATGI